jgi:hypothetical protein
VNPAPQPPAPVRDWWVLAGMATAAASAAVASFTGLRGLAIAAGWPARLAWLLPVTIDAYAMTSARVWLAGSTADRPGARRFARANALGAITTSVTGNAAYHAIGAGLLAVTWPVVVLVGAVPATVLGLTAHLHALHSRPAVPSTTDRSGTEDRTGAVPDEPVKSVPAESPGSATGDRTESGPQDGPGDGPQPARSRPRPRDRRRPRTRTADELLAAARAADARHRDRHGRPITRDALRAALRISGPRATELRRLLAAPPDPPPPQTPPGSPPADTPPAPDRKEALTL